jgi:hypothetical protein
VQSDDTGAPAPGQRKSVAEAWAANAGPLAAWAAEHLVNRRDICGSHYITEAGEHRRSTRYGEPSIEVLERHFAATTTGDVIGLHTTSPGNPDDEVPEETCKWGLVDIDAHTADDDPDANLRLAMHVLAVCAKAGLSALVLDSNGAGGYHILVLFEKPIPVSDAFRLLRWLVRDHAECGLEKRPETFPKSPKLTGRRCGDWVRGPGRHHKRDHWTRVWVPERHEGRGGWARGSAAIAALLRFESGPVDVAAIVPAGFGVAPPRPVVPRAGKSVPGDDSRDVRCANDALRHYPPNGLVYDEWLEIGMSLRQLEEPGRELFHSWSALSPKYDATDLDRRWDSLEAGDAMTTGGVTLGTLFARARQSGWPGHRVVGVNYQVDAADRPGTIYIVRGRAAYRALDARGCRVIGLPRRMLPVLDKVARLLEGVDRDVVVLGSAEPPLDAAKTAVALSRLIDRPVGGRQIPAPYQGVVEWLAAMTDNLDIHGE